MTEEEIQKLTQLCRISVSEKEKEALKQGIQQVLSYIDLLQEVDTKEVPPCHSILETLSNVTREDTVEELLSQDEFLSGAPSHIGGMIRVPPLFKS